MGLMENDWGTSRGMASNILDPFGHFGTGPQRRVEYDPNSIGEVDQSAYGPQQFEAARQMAAQGRQQAGQVGDMGRLLQERAQGRGGPSAAELQMRAGIGQAQMSAASMAAGSRNAAMGQRMAAQQQGQLALQGNQQAAILRAQEMAQATQGAAGQEMQRSQLQANYTNMGLGVEANAQMAQQRRAEQMQQREQFMAGLSSQQALAEAGYAQQQQGAGASAAGGLISGIAALSDKRAKKDIEKVSTNKLLDAIKAFKFKYKKPEHPQAGEGDQFGVMAQDLEKSDLGKTMVIDTPDGKMIDIKKVATGALASVAELHHRMKKLEGK